MLSSCQALFGADCTDASLHTRSIIQHANYDQNAHCGSGCSGNPWDAAWNISPTGWGDNHELGHNLQTNRLNVQYATAANRVIIGLAMVQPRGGKLQQYFPLCGAVEDPIICVTATRAASPMVI
ncbi:hypothetical protein N7V09_21320 [Shewanella seohaensis]|nr:hypothetical protein [Shewanella seohaensis]UXM82142.1 hypothetical protein N7V09_21320 [Shewanella seohaensis]